MNLYLITIEVESLTDRPDLLEAIVYACVTEGLAQYHEHGDLDPFATLRVLQAPPEALNEDQERVRRMSEDRLRLAHRIIEKRLTYRVEDHEQLRLAL